jgi:hypothetical protein
LNNVVLIFLLFISLAVSYAFAENPTPYNEWDFDITELTVQQNQSDLEKLDISITVLYKGELSTGIANVYADVTNPDGYSHKIFGQTMILSVGESQTIVLSAHMATDGKYEVDVTLSPPENPYLDHIFDAENIAFTVNPNGRERIMDSVGDYDESMISYSLQNYTDVRYNEMVHAVIALPEDHMFEKIAVVNGKFVREYSTDTKDIYINSAAPFKDLKVKLVKQGNLLPLADAQDTIQEFVKFYSNDKELCKKIFCVNIDHVEDEYEFPIIYLGIIPISGVAIVIVWHLFKTRPGQYPGDPTKHVNDKRSERDEKKEYETKDYIENTRNPLKLFSFS